MIDLFGCEQALFFKKIGKMTLKIFQRLTGLMPQISKLESLCWKPWAGTPIGIGPPSRAVWVTFPP